LTSRNPSIEIKVSSGRTLKTSPVFETYWRFAAMRQELFMRRVAGDRPPWTTDPVLANHRFTNAYRASDRVSQYLIKNVIYAGLSSVEEVFFRVMLFKFFNRIDTWERLETLAGPLEWRSFEIDRYSRVLDTMMSDGDRVYSAAYIMPSPGFGHARKHRNHLQLLAHMMASGAPKKVAKSKSLAEVFQIIRSYQSLGDFLAFQFTIDTNYSEITDFSEMDFVVAGPGARDGIRKCFTDPAGLTEAEIIRVVAERADHEFSRLGIKFPNLWGRKLQLIDCQNLFCEVDKYARVAHPEIQGTSGRTRIKQRFVPNCRCVPQWYPPKWGLKLPAETGSARAKSNRKPIQSNLQFGTF